MIADAYELTPLLAGRSTNGTGQTVVIIVACGDSTLVADLSTFDRAFGLADPTLTVYEPQGTPCYAPTSWGLETALDVEWAHVVAPGASIAVVVARSQRPASMYDAWNFSLASHLGSVLSNSWGTLGSCSRDAETLLATAVAQRVTVLAASGDNGPGRPWLATAPADCTATLTVGGTSLTVNATGAYQNETPWTGSGGGFVPGSREPNYQRYANISDPYAALGKPDVAAVGDPASGVWVYDNASGGWVVAAGTSLACPLWAGFLTDVNGWRAVRGLAPLGPLQPFLYQRIYGANGASPLYAVTFHDVTAGAGGIVLGRGWDISTGLGSLRGEPLARVLVGAPGA